MTADTITESPRTYCAICVEEYSPNPHCRDCHRTWTGKAEAHCTACCSHFGSDSAFDRHLAPARSDDLCYDPATIINRAGGAVFELVERVSGSVWCRIGPGRPFATTQKPINGVNRAGAE